jgi:hypothetical protein
LAAVALAALWLASGSLAAQSAKGKPGTMPRTPDGRPDFQGIYDVSTMTPVERGSEFGNRLIITDEEAAKLEGYEQQRKAKSEEASDPNRSAPPVGGEKGYLGAAPKSLNEQLFAGGGGTVGGYNNFWLAMGERLLTIDGKKRSSIVVDPEDGKVPAMKPEARKRNAALLARTVAPDANEASAAAGPASAYDDPELRPLAERCLLGFGSTSGPPTLPNYFYNNLKQIVQTPKTIVLHNEMVHDARVVRMGGQHPPKHIRRWMGDSIGRWEGDTLVIETTNFTNKTQFRGSGENLKVTERISRLDDKTLLYRFTVEDPDTWDRPWSGEYPWVASNENLYEYACHESNYSLSGILKGARLQDAEAAAKK